MEAVCRRCADRMEMGCQSRPVAGKPGRLGLRGVWAVRWPVVLARQADPSTGRRMMTQRLDPRSDRPLSLQLADVLRAEIQEGVRVPGSRLPTESECQHE